MCGIGGIIRYDGGLIEQARLKSMSQALAHRGPDDKGALIWDGKSVSVQRETEALGPGKAGLVHRRLSILDLSDNGRQPMMSSGGRYHIVFNGEIYNYLELREELIGLGQIFRTATDTEVLLAAYSTWGVECLQRLTGMFSFAVLDARKRTLFLARDFFGIKPLYWCASPESFSFASEINGLLAPGCIKPSPDPQGVYDYLRYGKPMSPERTVYKNVFHLPPAHHLTVSLDTFRPPAPVRYWQAELSTNKDISFDEAAERVRSMFLDNIRLHLRSDVPLGFALSGGIDSSSIVACVESVSTGSDLHAFSFIPDDLSISEEHWIDMAGDAAKAHVHKVRIHSGDLAGDMDNLLKAHGEPVLGSSSYAQYRVMRAASESGIKVMLDGQGGDEIFAGYQWHYGEIFASLLSRGQFHKVFSLYKNIRAMRGVTPSRLLAPFCFKVLPPFLTTLIRKGKGTTPHPTWIDADWFIEREVVMATTPTPPREGQFLKEELRRSVEQDLPQLLRYEDRNSMAHSIESRVPFLTPDFVNFIFSLPEEYLIDGQGTNKSVFRHAMRGLTPSPILDRSDKVGFVTPHAAWLADITPWLAAVLNDDSVGSLPVNRRALIDENGGIMFKQSSPATEVWRGSCLARWAQIYEIDFSEA